MKALSALLVTALLALLPLSVSSADSPTALQNVKGSVTYGPGNPGTLQQNKLALKSTAALSDFDWAATGADSLAAITLPDSSRIVMDANSDVQLHSFNLTYIAHASFFVVGKIRFDVNHPNGEKADYIFTTSTGQIAVRGTVGYIFAQPGGMQVVVVQASQPVTVTLASIGRVFTLVAGQSLVVTTVEGAVTASVGTASQSMLSSFSQLSDANLSSLGVSVTPTTAGATGAIAASAAAPAAAVVMQSAQPEPSTEQYRTNFSETQELEGKGKGYLIPLKRWVSNGLHCYYGQYYWLYPTGGTEVGNIPWPFCFEPANDPIAKGIRQFPFPLPMPGYQLPAGTYLYPIEKDAYEAWLASTRVGPRF